MKRVELFLVVEGCATVFLAKECMVNAVKEMWTLALYVVASDYTYKTEFCKGGKYEQRVFYKHCKNNWQAKYDFYIF